MGDTETQRAAILKWIGNLHRWCSIDEIRRKCSAASGLSRAVVNQDIRNLVERGRLEVMQVKADRVRNLYRATMPIGRSPRLQEVRRG